MRQKILYIFILSLLLLFSLSAYTQVPAAIKPAFESIQIEDLEAQLSFIASDFTEGRETASPGYNLAAQYAASLMKIWGVKPGGDPVYDRRTGEISSRSYFQTVPYEHIIEIENAFLKVKTKDGKFSRESIYNRNVDFSVYTGSSMNISQEVVFIGYGISDEGFDELKKTALKNKIVLMISGIPGETNKESGLYKKYEDKRRDWQWQHEMRMKVSECGVIGILSAPSAMRETPSNIGWNVNKPWRNTWGARHYEGDVPAEPRPDLNLITGKSSDPNPFRIQITRKVADEILKGSGFTLEELQKKIDSTGKPQSFLIKNSEVSVGVKVKSEIVNCKNVVGYVEGSDPVLKDELVVVGGHLDHLGKRSGMIYNGADDDGSGCVGVLELSEAFSLLENKPKRTTVFCLWSGEEHGLFGSMYFTIYPLKPIKNIIFYLNYDMIGRNNQDKEENKNEVRCTISAESPELEEIHDKNLNIIDDLNVNKSVRKNVSGGTDYTYFARNDVPVMGFFTGMHPDYHQMTDHVDKINFEKMEKIVKFGFLIMYEVANKEQRLKYEK